MNKSLFGEGVSCALWDVSSITGLYLLDASSTSPVVTTEMSPYVGKCPLGSKNATGPLLLLATTYGSVKAHVMGNTYDFLGAQGVRKWVEAEVEAGC